MREQCNTCAFRAGCVTHEDEPHNRLKAMICELAALPFYCHEGSDWKNQTLHGLTGTEAMALRRTMPVCEGWRQAVARAAADGRYPKGSALVRRLVGTRALQLLSHLLHGEAIMKAGVQAELQRMLELLAKVAPKRRKARGVRR